MNSIIKRDYQICKNCVMDTTDSKITFDEKGVCDGQKTFFVARGSMGVWKFLICNNLLISLAP